MNLEKMIEMKAMLDSLMKYKKGDDQESDDLEHQTDESDNEPEMLSKMKDMEGDEYKPENNDKKALIIALLQKKRNEA